MVALIKPQFEAPRGSVGKGGILRDEALRRAVIDERARDCAGAAGLGLTRGVDRLAGRRRGRQPRGVRSSAADASGRVAP